MWRSPVRASAPLGLRRGAGANTVGVVVVVALVVIAHFAPRPPSACNWRCHLLPPLLLPCVQHLTQYSSRFALYPSVRRVHRRHRHRLQRKLPVRHSRPGLARVFEPLLKGVVRLLVTRALQIYDHDHDHGIMSTTLSGNSQIKRAKSQAGTPRTFATL